MANTFIKKLLSESLDRHHAYRVLDAHRYKETSRGVYEHPNGQHKVVDHESDKGHYEVHHNGAHVATVHDHGHLDCVLKGMHC